MTLALRPTFSESWYRVAGLRVRLRSSAQISRQHYRGERWYVVRDPAGNQYHRLSDPAYRFVGLLDGRRTIEEAWDLCGGHLADEAPTQPEVIQILSHLYAANLIDADVTPDATVLLRRHKQQTTKKMQRRLMNVFFPRIPVWDPDRFLKTWLPLVRLAFSKVGAAVWLVVLAAALALVIPMWPQLAAEAAMAVNIYQNPINAVYMYLVFVLIKFVHELGHAFATRRFGGECHEMGIMLLVFVPTPYVDASSAWAFSSKWQRIFVGTAGMLVELFVAALCAFLWARTNPGELVHQLAYNAMLVASVTTLIFNINPLLRYDGYYMLSDWLEIPNLRQKSSDYSLGLLKRHIFRVKLQQPLPPFVQRLWLLTYAIASSIYRVFISLMIMLLVAFQIPILGVIMALGMVITFAVVPVVKMFKYLTVEPELHRKRGRAIAFTSAVVIGVIVLIGLIRFPYVVYAQGIVDAGEKQTLRTKEGGWVDRVRVRDGQWVRKGDPLIDLRSDTLQATAKQTQAQLSIQDTVRRAANAKLDPTERRIQEDRYGDLEKELQRLNQRLEDLRITAPFDGMFVNPDLAQLDGRYIAQGEELGTIMTMHEIRIRAVADQKDVERVFAHRVVNCQVRLISDVPRVIFASDPQRIGAAQPELISAALGTSGGGEIAVDPRDPTGKRSQVPQFEIRLRLANPDSRDLPGQRATIRMELDKKAPLLVQWSIRFWQLIQTEGAKYRW